MIKNCPIIVRDLFTGHGKVSTMYYVVVGLSQIFLPSQSRRVREQRQRELVRQQEVKESEVLHLTTESLFLKSKSDFVLKYEQKIIWAKTVYSNS
jgi:hypothetical protein